MPSIHKTGIPLLIKSAVAAKPAEPAPITTTSGLVCAKEIFGKAAKTKVEREDLKNYYKDASVLVVSSRDEGGPRVALEALFLEVPVLSTNVGHMSDILPQELLANKNDQKSLQKLLEKYVDNIDILNQEAIFDFVTKEYSIEKKINEIQKIYYSVLNS